MFYVRLLLTIKQKPTVDSQKKRESKHTITKNPQITKEDCKRGSKEQRIYKKEHNYNKMLIVSPYLSIIL